MIMVSTTGTDTADFTTVLAYLDISSSATWQKYSFALPDGANRYIAFRYLHYDGGPSGSGSNSIRLDDIRITRYTFEGGFSPNPASLAFGSVPITTSVEDTLFVRNLGNDPLSISGIASDDANFTVVPGSGVIPIGDSLEVRVTFTPATVGPKSGNIVFTHDASSSPDTVAVSGTGFNPVPQLFVSLPPDSIFNQDPVKPDKSKKPAKRVKPTKPINYPNWSNLLSEMTAQGAFQPVVSSEADSAGGMVIGESYMYMKNPIDPLKPKWSAIKDSANLYCWVRLTKWDFKKSIGKSYTALQKTLRNKAFNHLVPLNEPRGLDSTGVPGQIDPKRKMLKKQLTKLDSKKTPNMLFAELVALKVNIAASELQKTPAGFGDLIFDRDSSGFDEMTIMEISEKADSMMTYWKGYDSSAYADLHLTVYDINRAFVGVLDTATWQNHANLDSAKLTLDGVVDLTTVPFLKAPVPFIATTIRPTSIENESPEDYEDEEWDEDEEGVPVAAKLYQNYPNPFNPTTSISFRLREYSAVTLKIYNILGQHIATLLNGEELEDGYHVVEFAPDRLASGVYFYQINVQDSENEYGRILETKKMLLIK
jgi:hypothetical protein